MQSSITTWNYRIINNNGMLGIHEVFYSKGKPHSWAEEPECPQGMTIEDFKEDFKLMSQAFLRPVLTIKKGKLNAGK